MARFQINGYWYDAPTYAAARVMHQTAHPAVAPVVPAPVAAAPAGPVYTPVVNPVNDFPGRDPKRFGIGEEIDLGYSAVPPHVGTLQWVVKSGPGTLTAPVATNGTARLTMGDRAGTVILELQTIPAGQDYLAKLTLWVVEPSSAVIVKDPSRPNKQHQQNTASCGFWGKVYLRPTNVSFYRCQFREGSAPIKATGSMAVKVASTAPTSESGGQSQGVRQELGNLAGARHPVMGTWVQVGSGDSVNGCGLGAAADNIQSTTLYPPYALGTFDWEIHWFIKVLGSQNEKHFFTATHHEDVDALGRMTISKGGHVESSNAADPTTSK